MEQRATVPDLFPNFNRGLCSEDGRRSRRAAAPTWSLGAGGSGKDWITNLNLADDRLSFASGYFAQEPTGALTLDDALSVSDSAILRANTKEHGWIDIAVSDNVNAVQLEQMVANESILALSVAQVGNGAMGGVVSPTLPDVI